MTEFDKLRALLDMPRPAGPDQLYINEARAPIKRRATSPRPTQTRSAAVPAPMVRTNRRLRWTWLLWRVLLVTLILDALYLLATLRPM